MFSASGRSLIALLALLGFAVSAACSAPAPPPAKPSSDAAFTEIARGYLEDTYRRQPTLATFLGIHKYDEVIRDPSRQAVLDEIAAARQFRERAAAIDATTLSASNQLDREQLLLAIDSRILTLETVRPWARDPDSYSSGLTNTAYLMIKRAFAPPEERLRNLIAREKAMPATLAEARKNLDNPPRIYTEIAIEQIDGNRDFFRTAVASAFPTVTDKALLAEFKQANDAVIAALDDYKKWLKDDLLKRSNGRFRHRRRDVSEEARRRRDDRAPLDELLAIAEKDLRKNQAAFAETARLIDPKRTPMQVLEKVAGRLSARGEAAGDDAERARRARPVHDRPPPHHDPEGRAGRGPGDAAVPARDDERVDGHPRPVRNRGDRGVLQHDAAGSEVVGRRNSTSS